MNNIEDVKVIKSDFGFEISVPEGMKILKQTSIIDSRIKINDKYVDDVDISNSSQNRDEKVIELANKWKISNSEMIMMVALDSVGFDENKFLGEMVDGEIINIMVDDNVVSLDKYKDNNKIKSEVFKLNNGVDAVYLDLTEMKAMGISQIILIPVETEKNMFNGDEVKSIFVEVGINSMSKEELVNWVKTIKLN